MMRRSALACAVIISATALNSAGAQQRTPQDSVVRAVDRVFDAWRDTHGPGCAVGVGRNGTVLLERGYGMANLETDTPIGPSSIFHVASVSKQFTAMAIMLLEKDGKLSVNDDLRKYVPEIPDYGTPITIRHLLTHTSGLRDQWNLIGLSRGRFEENRITEADVMDILPRQTALNFKPGAEYVYSNSGFTLLAVIVKRVSGKSLRDFADERIFKPLGMTHTHFHDDYTMLVRGRTSAYAPSGTTWRVSIPNFDTYGATSLYTTVGDLIKWEANFDAPVVADRTIVERMEAPTLLANGDTSSYGFGITTGKYRGARVVEHNGADAGYRSYAGRFPQSGISIAVLCNAATSNTTALARGVADAFLGTSLAPVEVAVVPQAQPVSPELVARRAGVYVQPTTLQIGEFTASAGKLRIGRDGPELVAVAENRFRPANNAVEYLFGPGEHAGFERRPVSGGRATPFEWKAPVVATKALLSAYAGRYVSDELGGAVYTVTAGDSTIALRTGTESPDQARLMFADTFVMDGTTIQFTRTRGAITGFEVTDARVRRVKFVKR
ncbi:MAG: serine hydrolase domain-containing protein [Gemmatimonadaceae bacterium]